MTLGKGHLMATLPLFVAAMGYNLWYFTQGDDPVSVEAPQVAGAPAVEPRPSVAGEASPVDPRSIPPVPDAVLDRLPEWSRNPFADPRAPAVRAQDAPGIEAAQPAPAEPDIVVAMVFSGSNPRARVNGRVVHIGDKVGTALVVDIVPNGIVVESPDYGRRTITMRKGPAPKGGGGAQ
jgi:hypothetical protein